MKWKYEVASEIASRNADVANYANKPASWNKDTMYMPPDLLNFRQESLVVLNMSELIGILVVAFEIPIGR
jgi:hypothetical protein